jgi:hypothetical protein
LKDEVAGGLAVALGAARCPRSLDDVAGVGSDGDEAPFPSLLLHEEEPERLVVKGRFLDEL